MRRSVYYDNYELICWWNYNESYTKKNHKKDNNDKIHINKEVNKNTKVTNKETQTKKIWVVVNLLNCVDRMTNPEIMKILEADWPPLEY